MFHRFNLIALSISLRSSISLSMLLLVRCSIIYPTLTLSILLQHQISMLSRVRYSVLLSIHFSQSYSAVLHTYTFMKRFLALILILLVHKYYLLFTNADIVCAILDLIFIMHLSSWLIKLPRYIK